MKIDPKIKTLAVDVAERTTWTYLEAFFGAVILAPVINLSSVKAAAISGVAAGLTYLKATIAALRSGTVTPASVAALPAQPPPPPPAPAVELPKLPSSAPVAQPVAPPPPPPVEPPPTPDVLAAVQSYDGPVGMQVDSPTALLDVSSQTSSP